MRRAAPPQGVRVDNTDPGPWATIHHGPRGLGLASITPPEGVELAPDDRALRPSRGVPFATNESTLVVDGTILLTAAPNVARTIRTNDMSALFDRRPPGLMRVVGAGGANTALLQDAAGWRAVILPSMGDLAADLGPGPVAIRPDGRRVAVVHDGTVYELELPGAATTSVDVSSPPGAIAYAADGTLIAAVGGGIGGAPASDSPIVALAAARTAPRVIARHADGRLTLWDTTTGEVIGAWTPIILGPLSIALSDDGERVAMGTPFAEPAAACVARASDGALHRYIAQARTLALHPDGATMVVGGDWGALWLEPPREV